MSERYRLLMVEDSSSDAKLIANQLHRAGHDFEAKRVEDEAGLRAALLNEKWDIIISDWSLPRFSGSDALATVKELRIATPFIIVTGTAGEEVTVEAMRAGACDYVLKDKLARLVPAVERELRESRARAERNEALRRSEEQLRQAQKMEAIGNLAGGVAHDFNNLLTVIVSYALLLAEELAPNDPRRDDLEEIQRAGERATELTRQLLAFSRKQMLQPAVVDLNRIVSGVERMLQRLIGEDIVLSIVLDPELAPIEVDPGQIEQVIMNLVVNARDAMADGGSLTIQTSPASPEREDVVGEAGVLLTVRDTGIGMDQATQARIFEPFFTTKSKFKGTGLGLSTVFGIVKQSGGAIWVESELGQGASFYVYFPRAAEGRELSSHATGAGGEPALRHGTETILVVEDDDSTRTLVCNVLRRYGYSVLEARNGGDALMICEQHAAFIHLVLTDVVMPRMSGRQVAERLRSLRPTLKVLYMSGYSDDAVLNQGIADAGGAFIQKPVTPEQLTSKVRAVLDAQTLLQA